MSFSMLRHLPRAFMAVAVCLSLSTGAAQAAPFQAGFESVKVADAADKPIDAAVWFPTEQASEAVSFGPFKLDVARDAPVAGKALPLIVVSHGNGGSSLSHFDTAIALAQAGFVVVAVAHTGDNYADQSREVSMMDRPRHLSRAIDHMLSQWRGHELIDPSRIGVFGFSSGGFTALALVGGVADLGRVGPHCLEHQGDYACGVIRRRPEQAAAIAKMAPQSARDGRVRAAVVAAPALGFTFTRESLAGLSLPMQLWRAGDDTVLPHPYYAQAVREALTLPVDYREVPAAGHFDFLAPCSLRFALMAPPLCTSAPGFDREAFHRTFNTAVVGFFLKAMPAGKR